MARKNPFANLMDDRSDAERPALDYTIKGASKSIISSIDEIAARADKLLEGQTIVEIEPELIDASFVKDRMNEDPQDYQDLLAAIREDGQQSPILLRPHPRSVGRYMVVFGHRRLRIARELGRKVRAVVREMDDRAHVLAQGQENSARANLSFIEKAMFADALVRLNYDRDNATALSALAVDRATLSKMLTVASLPSPLLDAIGAARGIGRDRWYELKQLLEKPALREKALSFAESDEFRQASSSDDRFNRILAHVKTANRPARVSPRARSWSSEDKRLSVEMKTDGKNFTLAMKAKDAVGFGDYLSANLASLYDAYCRREKDETRGD